MYREIYNINTILLYLTRSYYTLMMWFPELFNRFEKFEQQQPGKDVSVCQVSSVYIEQNGVLNTADLCGSEVAESVYTHTLWIGIACIPTSLWMPLCVHRLGAKFFLGKTRRSKPFSVRLNPIRVEVKRNQNSLASKNTKFMFSYEFPFCPTRFTVS